VSHPETKGVATLDGSSYVSLFDALPVVLDDRG
jgi:hypothetical protein